MTLRAVGISFGYGSGQEVLRGADISIDDGQLVFVLGANGSGKSTLLRLLVGIRAPWEGAILLDGTPSRGLGPRERARRVAMVPQVEPPGIGYTVSELVVMGRAAHLGFFSRPRQVDRQIAMDALAAVGMAGLASRRADEISGGERQLALIARGLAQGARTLLLDEPDAHLDPRYQDRVLTALTGLTAEGLSLMVTSHHPNNALLYSDVVSFLIDGRCTVTAPPQEAMTASRLRAAYGMAFDVVRGEQDAWALLPHRGRGV